MTNFSNYTEEFKDGYMAVIEQSTEDDCACEFWAPENQFQHGWNAACRALVLRDRRHEENARQAMLAP